ncbi:hypothetical protein E2C01_026642 [Portunus trituberculatus]|uniref:Uncharacterized protein n=1 Tax=Portunus trituberculatus TaxID=210409 RepID=A0A5B7EIW1_PORTR|nr:hypothetical protein [Portunus trituberculatus]
MTCMGNGGGCGQHVQLSLIDPNGGQKEEWSSMATNGGKVQRNSEDAKITGGGLPRLAFRHRLKRVDSFLYRRLESGQAHL